jgi:hypothetical protein
MNDQDLLVETIAELASVQEQYLYTLQYIMKNYITDMYLLSISLIGDHEIK